MYLSFLIPVLTAVGVGGLLFYLLLALRDNGGSKNLPPGHVSFFSSFINPKDIGAAFKKLRDDPRPVFRFMLFGINFAVINDAEMARSVMSKDGDVVSSSWPSTVQELLGSCSFSATHGPYHRHIRKLLAQGFSSQAIESYLPRIQEVVERRLAVWSLEERVPMQDQARFLTFEVMAVIVAGCEMSDEQLAVLAEQFDIFTKGLFFVRHINLPWTAFGKAKKARAIIVAAIEEQLARVVSEQQKQQVQQEDQPSKHGFLMEKLVGAVDENGQPLSRKALQDVGVSLLFAGHETTAMTLTLLLMLLLERGDVWERLQAEQRQVVAAHGEAITGEALRDMTYLDAVVKEGWRWHPLVGSVPRLMLRDAEIGGYTVPKGWKLLVNLETMLRADGAQRWGTAEGLGAKDFNPDRWLGPQGGGMGVLPGANTFVFGVGSRTCVGAPLAWAEFKVVMAILARKYHVLNALDHAPTWTTAPIAFEERLPVHIKPLAA